MPSGSRKKVFISPCGLKIIFQIAATTTQLITTGMK
jgi:hypothetical protein